MGGKRARGAAAHQLEFFARCAGGFEEMLGQELRSLRLARVRPQVGGVIFFGSLADGYRACLWSRVATRIQLVIARVPAADAEALYTGVAALPWEAHVPIGATIAVDAHGENPQLRNTQFSALKVKDALCDRLRAVRGVRPDVDPKHPDVQVNVAIHPQKATVYLNLSGASLHRRGYRQEGVQTAAPLKETLAAGILLAAGWPELADTGGCLVDPMCGSGTLAIEAALMAVHAAPGLLRERWGFEGWAGHDQALWERVRAEAEGARQWPSSVPRLLAADLDPRAVEIARANAERAGVADQLRLCVADATDLRRTLRALPDHRERQGLLACNPPYGMRLLSEAELPQVHAALAAAVDALPRGWQVALITPDGGMDTALGRVPEQVLSCRNGPIQAWLRLYGTDEPPRAHDVTSRAGVSRKVRIAEANSAQFAARLRKVAKERARWAVREGVSCYRVYDADLPDYALSVDLYQGAGADDGLRCLVLSERRRPTSVDDLRAARRLADAAALAAAVCDVDAGAVVVRGWQAGRVADAPLDAPVHRYLSVEEGGCHFRVDLMRPAAELPLGQRGLRELAASKAQGAHIAALFATSGAALVRAAHAGARATVAVDGAADWLDGVSRMMRANGQTGAAHTCACADVRRWVAQEWQAHHRYDLVLCVAPAWLPARDAGGTDWDFCRDGTSLARAAARLLTQGGALLFACEGDAACLDVRALERAGLVVHDVSAQVRTADFERARQRLSCWVLRHAGRGALHA